MRVRLEVPNAERWKCASPAIHGEHFAHDKQAGTVLCGAGAGGVWVRFDAQAQNQYVGVPVAWLTKEEA